MTESHPRRNVKKQVRVEPTATLEWSQAVELAGELAEATGPEDIRRAWIHRAPERQVVGLYRVLTKFEPDLPAPWWLRALAAGGLPTRTAAFRMEDEVGRLLAERPGWVYVPWEDGYWEYTMKPGFEDEFPAERYMTPHDNKPGEYQWIIPQEEIPKFNSHIQSSRWINYYMGHTW